VDYTHKIYKQISLMSYLMGKNIKKEKNKTNQFLTILIFQKDKSYNYENNMLFLMNYTRL